MFSYLHNTYEKNVLSDEGREARRDIIEEARNRFGQGYAMVNLAELYPCSIISRFSSEDLRNSEL